MKQMTEQEIKTLSCFLDGTVFTGDEEIDTLYREYPLKYLTPEERLIVRLGCDEPLTELIDFVEKYNEAFKKEFGITPYQEYLRNLVRGGTNE